MRIAFSTLACAQWSWEQLLQNARDYGYPGVEIRFLADSTDLLAAEPFRPENHERTRKQMAQAGIQVACLASSVRFDYLEREQIEEQISTGRTYIELCDQLDIAALRVFGDSFPEPALRKRIVAQVVDGLQRLGEFAEPRGVQVVIETHGDFSDSAVMQETIERVGSPAVGVLWDTHHPWRFYGEAPAETFQRIGRWVRHTHWKDSVAGAQRQTTAASGQAAAEAHALMSGHRHADYVLFGQGEFPAREVLALLRRSGYDGWYSLEWEKKWHPELADPEVALPPFPKVMQQLWESIERK
jgi:sugar phosphate isomerase/epimerase